MPSRRAANATACPKFPRVAVTTTRAAPPASRNRRKYTSAPRILKAPSGP
jgi:hypothetical protein